MPPPRRPMDTAILIERLNEKIDNLGHEVNAVKLLMEQRVIPLESKNNERDSKVKSLEDRCNNHEERLTELEQLRAEARGGVVAVRALWGALVALAGVLGFLLDHFINRG